MPDLSKLRNLAGALKEKERRAHGDAYRIVNQGPATDVWIYDLIGEQWDGSGVTASAFARDLAAVKSGVLNIHINSEGGSVFDGIAIYEAIKQHPAQTNILIDSLAASAASFIAMAGDNIRMARNARIMVHDAAMGFGMAGGNAADMRAFAKEVIEMADMLDDMSNNIADIYAQRAGQDVAHWRAVMEKETWFNATDAAAAGLIDGIIGEDVPAAPAEEQEPAAVNELELDFSALMAAIEEGFTRG